MVSCYIEQRIARSIAYNTLDTRAERWLQVFKSNLRITDQAQSVKKKMPELPFAARCEQYYWNNYWNLYSDEQSCVYYTHWMLSNKLTTFD